MVQLSFDDLTVPIEDVIRAEGTTMDGEQLFWQGEHFYRNNPELLAAHKQAARAFQELGYSVPPKLLTEITRYFSLLGRDGFARVVMSYFGVNWKRDDPFSITNNTTPWLGRWLKSVGFEVDTRKSKIDDVWEREHGEQAR